MRLACLPSQWIYFPPSLLFIIHQLVPGQKGLSVWRGQWLLAAADWPISTTLFRAVDRATEPAVSIDFASCSRLLCSWAPLARSTAPPPASIQRPHAAGDRLQRLVLTSTTISYGTGLSAISMMTLIWPAVFVDRALV